MMVQPRKNQQKKGGEKINYNKKNWIKNINILLFKNGTH
jgi:hypothetical protein